MILSTTAASLLMTGSIDNCERSIDHLQELIVSSKNALSSVLPVVIAAKCEGARSGVYLSF